MSLSIIEIKAVPQYLLLGTDADTAKQSVRRAFDDLLSYISSISRDEALAVEIVFLKALWKEPRILLTIRSNDGGTTIPAAQVSHTIKERLVQSHFSVQEIGDDFSSVIGEMRTILSGNLAAITKEEKIITSAVSYSGYYYYTDILDPLCGNAVLSNYASLFYQLQTYKKALISFQLIPTKVQQNEYLALSSLSAELATTTQGIYVNHQMVRETTAQAPQKVYSYYTERASQPLFVGNILVASEQEDLNGLTSAVKTYIQSSLVEPVGLSCVFFPKGNNLVRDFFNLPWNVCNLLLTQYRNYNIWNGSANQPTNLMRLPYLYTAAEATTFFRLPIDDGSIQGVHINRVANDNEIIGENVLAADNIQFGKLLNSDDVVIGADATAFTTHALIVGAPGSGKTTFALNLLLQFYRKGIPFLAIEPTKTEYRALIDVIPDLQVFTPGKTDVAPFIINPFIPPRGIRLEQYIPSLMSAFRAAFAMESPLDVLFLRAIKQCYAQYGWKNSSTVDDSNAQPFGLYEFIKTFQQLVSTSSYKPETKANIETGGTFRLLNLIDQSKFTYDTVNTIPIEELLNKPTVLELNAIADDEQKSLIMALLLVSVCLYTKEQGSISGQINNVLMIDEAHVLLDASLKGNSEQGKSQASTVKSLQKMVAEIRSFGTGIIIADQLPSKVTSDIVANTDLKIVFRLVENNERLIISNSMNMPELQMQHLARLKKGEAITYYSDLESPKIIKTPDVRKTEGIRHKISDDEIRARNTFWNDKQALLVPYFECSTCSQCKHCGKCDISVREKADYYASRILSAIGTRIKDRETLVKYMYRLHDLVVSYEVNAAVRSPIKKICNCTKIHFLRSILVENGIALSRDATTDLLNKTLIKEGTGNV